MKRAEYEYLDHRIDQVLEILKEVVRYTASTNADCDYLEERINELLYEVPCVTFDNAEHCVYCGDVIPEGRMICPTCEKRGMTHCETAG